MVFKSSTTDCKIKRAITNPYYPKHNGLAETTVKLVKKILDQLKSNSSYNRHSINLQEYYIGDFYLSWATLQSIL